LVRSILSALLRRFLARVYRPVPDVDQSEQMLCLDEFRILRDHLPQRDGRHILVVAAALLQREVVPLDGLVDGGELALVRLQLFDEFSAILSSSWRFLLMTHSLRAATASPISK
jgi:hypothetical protein